MKFKIDENLPIECVELFRKVGYQADTVNDEKLNGSPDSTIYSVCIDEGRVLVTLDFGFFKYKIISAEFTQRYYCSEVGKSKQI